MHWHPNDDEWQYYLEGKARRIAAPQLPLSMGRCLIQNVTGVKLQGTVQQNAWTLTQLAIGMDKACGDGIGIVGLGREELVERLPSLFAIHLEVPPGISVCSAVIATGIIFKRYTVAATLSDHTAEMEAP